MPDRAVALLLVDDDEDDYLITRGMLAEQNRLPVRLDWTPEYDDALQIIQRAKHDLYLIDYRLEVRYDGSEPHVVADAYRFLPTLGEVDLHLFGEGRHERPPDLAHSHGTRR